MSRKRMYVAFAVELLGVMGGHVVRTAPTKKREHPEEDKDDVSEQITVENLPQAKMFTTNSNIGRKKELHTHVKWRARVHLSWERETWTTINVLGIVSEGGHEDDMSTDRRDVMPGRMGGEEKVKARGEDAEGESRDCSPDNSTENKASPARPMGIKQNKKQSHRLHHPRSDRLHAAAMSLTGDEGSSGPMSFLGKER